MKPGIYLAFAVSLALWLAIYAVVGPLIFGVLLMVTGAGWLGVCAALSAKPKPPKWTVIREERIGAHDKTGRFRPSRSELRRRAA